MSNSTSLPARWDVEADVIILGGGTAGLPAAIEIARAGLKATVLEARPACGGSFAMVVGSMIIAGSDEQKAQGIDDSPDILYKDMVEICGTDPDLARAYADTQLDAYRMLKQGGVEFPGLVPMPLHSRLRGLGWLYGIGPKMVKALEKLAREAGVEILFRHRATKILTNPESGRVIGVVVDAKDSTKYFKARKSVIIATGGFGRNRDMIEEYCPEMVDGIPCMPVSHLGDGLKMALAVGAATKDIGKAVAPAWPISADSHLNVIAATRWGGLLVNVNGNRFHDESCSEGFYGPMTGEGMKQPGSVYWMIFDASILENLINNEDDGHIKNVERSKKYQGNTIEELARDAGIDSEGLIKTVDTYNNDVATKAYDSVFGRKNQWGSTRPLVKIVNAPFYAIKCVTAITSMKGGLKINSRAQVINNHGEVIPGLYAAGEVVGGLHHKTYLLGVMTSGSMSLGIIAARNSIKETA